MIKLSYPYTLAGVILHQKDRGFNSNTVKLDSIFSQKLIKDIKINNNTLETVRKKPKIEG